LLDEGYMYFISKDAFVRRRLYVPYFPRRHLFGEGYMYFISKEAFVRRRSYVLYFQGRIC